MTTDYVVWQSPENVLLKVTVISFGYLHGDPPPAHLTIDLREGLHNPAADPAMRYLTGLEQPVREHVLATPGATDVLTTLVANTMVLHQLNDPRGLKTTIAIGCAGGRHRSVVLANELMQLLNELGVATEIEHRDVARPVVERLRSRPADDER